MTRSIAVLFLVVARATVASAAEPAEDRPGFSAGADLSVTSAYIWRGFVENDTLSVQPNLWLTFGDVTVSSWMNASRVGPNGRSFTERDFTMGYGHTFGTWAVSAGWTNYTFVDVSEDRYSNEVYATVGHDSYLLPTLRLYQDVHQGSGSYISVGVSHEYEVRRGVTLTPLFSIGYNHQQWIDASTFSDANVGLALGVPLIGDRLRIEPSINYNKSLNRGFFEDRLYGGVTVSVR